MPQHWEFEDHRQESIPFLDICLAAQEWCALQVLAFETRLNAQTFESVGIINFVDKPQKGRPIVERTSVQSPEIIAALNVQIVFDLIADVQLRNPRIVESDKQGIHPGILGGQNIGDLGGQTRQEKSLWCTAVIGDGVFGSF